MKIKELIDKKLQKIIIFKEKTRNWQNSELTTALARAFASNSTADKPELFKRSSAADLNAGITLH